MQSDRRGKGKNKVEGEVRNRERMRVEGTREGKWVKGDGREVRERRRVREGIEGGDSKVRIERERRIGNGFGRHGGGIGGRRIEE